MVLTDWLFITRALGGHAEGVRSRAPAFSFPVLAGQGLDDLLPNALLLPLAEVVVDGGPVFLLGTLAGRPPGLGAGMRGSRGAHSASLRSLG